MTKQKSTKRALLMSALALVMCFSMLVGSTFAWFTDEVSTSVNKIQSGKLEVALEYSVNNGGTWEDAESETLDFIKSVSAPAGEEILWEPGCTYNLPLIRVKNNGNLALKYEIVLTGVDGNAELLNAIEFTANGEALSKLNGELKAGETSASIQITGHMKEDAGNEYQDKSITGIGITVYATQLAHEYDSFHNQYDANINAIRNGNISKAGNMYYVAAELVNVYDVTATSLAINVVDANGAILTTITPADGALGYVTDGKITSLTCCAELTGSDDYWNHTAWVPTADAVPVQMQLVVNGKIVDTCPITAGTATWTDVVNAYNN